MSVIIFVNEISESEGVHVHKSVLEQTCSQEKDELICNSINKCTKNLFLYTLANLRYYK